MDCKDISDIISEQMKPNKEFQNFKAIIRKFYKELELFNQKNNNLNNQAENVIIFKDSLITFIDKIENSEQLNLSYKLYYYYSIL